MKNSSPSKDQQKIKHLNILHKANQRYSLGANNPLFRRENSLEMRKKTEHMLELTEQSPILPMISQINFHEKSPHLKTTRYNSRQDSEG